jgi:hypothetical protein
MVDGLRGPCGPHVQERVMEVANLEHVRVQTLHQLMAGKTARESV